MSSDKEMEDGCFDSGTMNDYNGKNSEMETTPNDDKQLIPKSGMTFSSEHEVQKFYVAYAHQQGFGVTKRSTKRDDDGKLRYVTFACARGGKRVSTIKNSFNPGPLIKQGCKAKINVIFDSDGKFIISGVNLQHNHALSPQKSRFFPSHKKIDAHAKRRLEVNDEAGIGASRNYHSMAVEAGGYENLTYTEKDCMNYIAKARKLRLGSGDSEALSNYLSRMKERNPNFFYDFKLDEEGRLQNIFWADARSIAVHECFGDVISFDTTYLTNDYNMPFAPFVGVNHHGQTILFGCGLLSNEDTDSYIWLFKTWLECMSHRAPNAIITDQCSAIRGAIEKVFPNSHHHLCLWHIMRKVPDKLRRLKQYKEIKKILKRVVYESVEIKEFKKTWAEMIADYSLEENKWLASLNEVHHCWVPVYVKEVFWAGMSTTQQSESMNAFFDGYVGPKTSLKQFVEQYDYALKIKIEKENMADFHSFNSNIQPITDFQFEEQLQEAYTNEIFKLFQDELRGLIYCNLKLSEIVDSTFTYQVKDMFRGKDGTHKRQVLYDVQYNEIELSIKCSCCLFEFKGIVCRHIVKVLIENNVKEIPSQYILARWRKDIKHRHVYVKNCYEDDVNVDRKVRYHNLYSQFSKAVEIGVDCIEKYDFLMKFMEEAIEKLKNNSNFGNKQDGTVLFADEEEQHHIANSNKQFLTPLKAQTKGRPCSKRKVSKIEQFLNKSKKQKPNEKRSKQTQEKRKKLHLNNKMNMDCSYLSSVSIDPNLQQNDNFEGNFVMDAIDLNNSPKGSLKGIFQKF